MPSASVPQPPPTTDGPSGPWVAADAGGLQLPNLVERSLIDWQGLTGVVSRGGATRAWEHSQRRSSSSCEGPC